MNNQLLAKLERASARFAVVVGIVHGLGETVWEWFYDQSLAMLLVDYIAVALLLYTGISFLRRASTAAAGLLAGAWGFTACLLYRVFFERLDEFLAKGGQRGHAASGTGLVPRFARPGIYGHRPELRRFDVSGVSAWKGRLI